jgi:predicted DsbA family dithiol-disulfide isomerase
VDISYYTDPACPWSWALEPTSRKLSDKFGASLRITYVMGGMAKEFGDPEQLIGESLDASERSGMPVDPRLWLNGGSRSEWRIKPERLGTGELWTLA